MYTLERFQRTDNNPYSAIGTGYEYDWVPIPGAEFESFYEAKRHARTIAREGIRISDGKQNWMAH